MEKHKVELGEKSYNIFFEDSFCALSKCMDEIGAPKKLLVITDSNVLPLYADEVREVLSSAGYDVCLASFPAGEQNKNMETILCLCEACVENQLDRKSMIVALGGGVVGDMAGFCASIYMRGIDFVQIPTTLLSQSDSSVGGKTGIDFKNAKNILGAFHQPKMVYINVNTLKTLPRREFISGMGEVIKHGIIRDKELFDFVENNSDEILSLNAESLIKLTHANCAVKADVVSHDERESGLRRILNFGHTIGHAIEAASNFEKTHGGCVALGMICMYIICEKRGIVSSDEVKRVIALLEKYGFETKVKVCDYNEIISLVRMDKKKQGSKVTFVIPNGIGEVDFKDDITDDEIIYALKFIEEN